MSGKVALKVSPIKRIGGRRAVMKMIEEDLARQTFLLLIILIEAIRSHQSLGSFVTSCCHLLLICINNKIHIVKQNFQMS